MPLRLPSKMSGNQELGGGGDVVRSAEAELRRTRTCQEESYYSH